MGIKRELTFQSKKPRASNMFETDYIHSLYTTRSHANRATLKSIDTGTFKSITHKPLSKLGFEGLLGGRLAAN